MMVLPEIFQPFYLARRALRGEIAALGSKLTGTLVDIGCGVKPYLPLFPGCSYIGLEVPVASRYGSAKNADVYFDGRSIPLVDGCADVVLCTQVLEHVFEPDALLREIRRICRPGGRLLLTVPFVWDEHEQPYDYARYSSFGLAYLLRRHGFRVDEHRRTLPDASIFAQLWLVYLYKVTQSLPRLPRLALLNLAALPCNLLGHALRWILPSNSDFYLDNVLLATREP